MTEENYNHRVIVTNREQVVVEGVIHVDKFDDEEIVLETDLGMMALRGEDLHIKQLSLESGELVVEGIVRIVEYLEDGGRVGKGKGKGFFDRIFS